MFILFLLSVLGSEATNAAPVGAGATVIVATRDSSAQSRAMAQFVGDGEGDQAEIMAAIASLPPVGGTVLLMEGTYNIRKVEGTLGGVTIERSNVALAGIGPATRLVLAPDQNTNVIRIIGPNVGNIVIRDLEVDANREHNSAGTGDPNVSHDRFEFCGIKAFCRRPGGSISEPTHDITIRNTTVRNAHRLGIMLEGPNMRVIDNVLGNAGSDAVEILMGPGQIRGNYVEITGQTHVAIGSDRADSMLMTDNIVHVKQGGSLDIAFRSWAGSKRHVIANNVVTVDPEGVCRHAIDARGTFTTITGNCLQGPSSEPRMRLTIAAGDAIVSGNTLENLVVEIDDKTGEGRPIILGRNLLNNSIVEHKVGNLTQEEHPPSPLQRGN